MSDIMSTKIEPVAWMDSTSNRCTKHFRPDWLNPIPLVPKSEYDALERRVEEAMAALREARRFIAPLAEDVSYGFARPDNPHDFSPDQESCSAEEIAAHKAACEAYDRGEYDPKADPTSINAGPLHILRAPWGIGSSTWRDPEAAAALANIDAALRELDAAKPGIVGKPLEWEFSDTEDNQWNDKHCGFWISFDPLDDPEYRYIAAWGEGDVEHFATLDEAKAWCQSELDAWIGKHATLGTRGESPDYAKRNPLGGPAKMFEAMAARIRGGEPLEDVMRDYGVRFDGKEAR